jgi:hypothetical protein
MSKKEDSGDQAGNMCPMKGARANGVENRGGKSKAFKQKANKKLVRMMNYLLSAGQVKRLVDEGDLAYPKCGGKSILWGCCNATRRAPFDNTKTNASVFPTRAPI